MADYSNPEALVETAWLEQHADDSNIAIVECDEDITAYEKGHIPNAISIDWANELHDAPRREFVSPEQLADLLGKKGISNDQTIVLYSGNNNWFAAYAYWYFKLYGHRDVRLLHGGRKRWELDERPLAGESVARPTTQYVAQEPNAPQEQNFDGSWVEYGSLIGVAIER